MIYLAGLCQKRPLPSVWLGMSGHKLGIFINHNLYHRQREYTANNCRNLISITYPLGDDAYKKNQITNVPRSIDITMYLHYACKSNCTKYEICFLSQFITVLSRYVYMVEMLMYRPCSIRYIYIYHVYLVYNVTRLIYKIMAQC